MTKMRALSSGVHSKHIPSVDSVKILDAQER